MNWEKELIAILLRLEQRITNIETFINKYEIKTGPRMTETQLKNMLSFLSILFGEDLYLSNELMEKSPHYLLEKWERYVESTRDEHPWGLHPNLRHNYFDRYFDKWKEQISELYE